MSSPLETINEIDNFIFNDITGHDENLFDEQKEKGEFAEDINDEIRNAQITEEIGHLNASSQD